MKKILHSERAPQAIGPYSQAIELNGVVYTSGQIPLNANDELVSESVEKQTEQVMDNIRVILEDNGLSMEDIIKATIYTTDLSAFPVINEIYGEKLQGNKPARSCIEVSALPKGAKVKVDVVASRS